MTKDGFHGNWCNCIMPNCQMKADLWKVVDAETASLKLQVDALKLENTVLLKDKQYGPTDRLLSWVESEEGRKTPSQAFTAGPERRIADLWLMLEGERDRLDRQIQEAMKACTWVTHKENHTEPKHCVASLASLIEMRQSEKREEEPQLDTCVLPRNGIGRCERYCSAYQATSHDHSRSCVVTAKLEGRES